MLNYNDLTDDEDFLELVEHIVVPRAPRQYQQRPNHFEIWNDKQFITRFRLSKAVVTLITEETELEIRNNSVRIGCDASAHAADSSGAFKSSL
ncbi:hypothetical protein FQA39_LY09039 [Lamprigera yunnana]|nr:hypothetical protein FQA39_LY09039 [Lamprigera yunnana]